MEVRAEPDAPHPPVPWRWALVLFFGTLWLYLGVHRNGFVAYDDGTYVAQNPHVEDGLSLDAIGWALSSASYACNWHPVTWISHMLDVSLFGMNPAGHHLHSALLHALNAALLLLLLTSLTGAFRRSALVAALFAAHPLRVESVAWISERKDLLAATYLLLALFAYARWVRDRRPLHAILLLLCFALGLAAKPMIVTLPALLLLLDVWPLARKESFGKRVLEKAPLFFLAGLSCLITMRAQSAGGCTEFIDAGVHLGARLANAIGAYGHYLLRAVFPVDLAVFYPHPAVVQPGVSRLPTVAAASLALLLLSALAFRLRKRTPAVLVGWLWFLGSLVPVLGLVQVGGQAYADRYAYLPLIGIEVAAVWGIADAVRSRPTRQAAAFTIALLFALALGGQTERQIRVWRTTRSLFQHALDVTSGNYVAHANLGRLDGTAGDLVSAEKHFRRAVEENPAFYEGQLNLGWVLNLEGSQEQALPPLERAIRLRPDQPDAHFKRGIVLGNLGRNAEAIAEVQATLRLDPEHPTALKLLAELRRRGKDGG